MKEFGIEDLVGFIQAELQKQKLAQNELAEKCGLSSSTMSRIVNGQVVPSLSTIQVIARGLGYDFYSFILAAAGLQDVRESEIMQVFQHLTPEHQRLLLEIAWQFPEASRHDRVIGSEIFVEGST